MPEPNRVTARMAAEMNALVGRVSIAKIAVKFGVNPSTVYYHTNKRHHDKRQASYRRHQAKRSAECRRRAFEAFVTGGEMVVYHALQEPETALFRYPNGTYANAYIQAAWLGFNAPRRNVKESIN